jgi:MazG family protein
VSPRKPMQRRTRTRKLAADKKKSGATSARQPKPREGRNRAVPKGSRIGDQFEALVSIQARLRAPGGCPWDRRQTHETLRTYLLEEAYEVLEAIDKANPQELSEELGDLLLQVLFHAELAREAGRFDISSVIQNIHDKLGRRHPHVFGDVKADTPEQVVKNWEKLKTEERLGSSKAPPGDQIAPSALDGIPRTLPALLEALQLTRRAARVGFDWHNVEGIFDKLDEEVAELRKALSEGGASRLEDELGDLLFVIVNLARHLKIDPEVALTHANRKFKSRFQDMESAARSEAQRLGDMSQEELEALWEAAKARARATTSQGTS